MSDQRNDINNTKISGYLEKKSKLVSNMQILRIKEELLTCSYFIED